MKTNLSHLFIVLVLFAGIHQAVAQGTEFTYQGRLNNGGSPATGLYDFRFKLYVDPFGNTQAGASYFTNAVPATNGLFITTIDFGPGIFTGTTNWLEVGVRTNGGGGYTVLSPLQNLTPTPDAVFAETAGSLSGVLPAAQLGGTILNSSLPASPNFGGTVQANLFSGNGAGVTNVNAALLGGLAASNYWQTGGNNVAQGQFLGSTNNQPVEIWVNGQRALRLEPNTNSPNIIGGYAGNSVGGILAYGVTIGGGGQSGLPNSIQGTNVTFATIAGGVANTISGTNAYHSTIGGGYNNTITGDNAYEATIAGGGANSNQAWASAIGGGTGNFIQPYADHATIAGGYNNWIQSVGWDSFISGGYGGIIQSNAQFAGIGGGDYNTNGSSFAFIGGGSHHFIQYNSWGALIGAGYQNTILTGSGYSVIGGGYQNTVQTNASWSMIGGGQYNQIYGDFDFYGGSVIAGGYANVIQTNASDSAIGGGYDNEIFGDLYDAGGSFIGGGIYNLIQTNSYSSTIAGGADNQIQTNSAFSFIGGGVYNQIRNNSTIATIGGGEYNYILTNASFGTIGGGANNQVGGAGGTVPGGNGNHAGGINSFAAGTEAYATNDGSFVLADLEYVPFYSTTNNQFSARFTNGFAFYSAGAGMTLDGQSVLTSGYGNAVNLNNAANNFTGNGSGLTGVNATTLNGFSSSSFAAASGSTNYIQNQSASPQPASFDISGTATSSSLVVSNNAQITGLIRSGSETGTSNAPSPAGLVIRRINSYNAAYGQVVARTDTLTLIRDGTPGGFLIFIPPSVGNITIACMGIDNTGAQKNVYVGYASGTAEAVQIYSDSQNIVHFECTFGVTYLSNQHLTQVTLSRYANGAILDNYWSGNVISTYNQ